jgi:hypothetical protein
MPGKVKANACPPPTLPLPPGVTVLPGSPTPRQQATALLLQTLQHSGHQAALSPHEVPFLP